MRAINATWPAVASTQRVLSATKVRNVVRCVRVCVCVCACMCVNVLVRVYREIYECILTKWSRVWTSSIPHPLTLSQHTPGVVRGLRYLEEAGGGDFDLFADDDGVGYAMYKLSG